MRKLILFVLLTTISITAFSQKKQEKKKASWDVNNPHQDWKYKSFNLKTDEETWMNLDVSTDGKTIIFDMLGDIYSMPITGGKATALRTGLAYEVQPRFSPDGKYISFTSDLEGGNNIWVMTSVVDVHAHVGAFING